MAYRFNLPLDDVGDGIADFAGAQIFVFDFGTTTPKTTFSDFALTVPNTDPIVADADGLFGDIFVDVQVSMELQTSASVQVYTADVFAPEDGISALAAVDVAITDTGGFYTAADVEAALAELAADYSLGNANNLTANQTFVGANLVMNNNVVARPEILDYSVTTTTAASVSNVITLDMSLGNVFTTTLTENINTITVTNPPATGSYGELLWIVTQDAASSFTIAWSATFLYPGGIDPVMTATVNAIDEFSLHTTDAGTTFLCNFSQAFA